MIKSAEEVIYIGKSHHPETVAALTMNKNTHLYDISSGLNYSELKTDHPLVINQTTLSFLELGNIHQEIRNRLINRRLSNKKKHAVLMTTWMNLKIIRLSKRSPSIEDIYSGIPFLRNSRISKSNL